MDKKEILRHIDHTLLKPYAVWEDIEKLCREAVEYGTASVCIPPCYVGRVHDKFETLNICTVVGFPLGYSVTAAKAAEVEQAVRDGANEIDMVVNISDVKNHQYGKVEAEIRMLKEACQGRVLKVIIETCFLTEAEKIRLCHVVTDSGADYIKTSTGFGSGGATFEDVKLFAENVGPGVKIKAAGGITSLEDAEKFIELGASRLGTSRIIKLVKRGV